MDTDPQDLIDSDNDMHVDARTSDSHGAPSRATSITNFSQFFDANDMDPQASHVTLPNALSTLDLLDRMQRTYRLLDLIYEQGSGGAGV